MGIGYNILDPHIFDLTNYNYYILIIITLKPSCFSTPRRWRRKPIQLSKIVRTELQARTTFEKTSVVWMRATKPILLYDMFHILQAERRSQKTYDSSASC